MSNSVLLVCLPPNPLTFAALRPRSDVAALAAAFNAAGAQVRVADFATLERVPQFVSREALVAIPASPAGDDANLSGIDFSHRTLTPIYFSAALRAFRPILTGAQADTVVFVATSPFESRTARALIGELDLTNATVVTDGQFQPTGSAADECIREAVAGAAAGGSAYQPDLYPSLRDETKLRVFDIGTEASTGESVSGLFAILEETAALNRYYGTRAFHLGRSVAGNQLSHLASEFVTRDSRFRYSVSAAMADYPAELAAVAAASGCVAASFRIGSGSQRLLDRYFAYSFRLHKAERTIRAFAEAGIHTRIELTYPCIMDDFHTRDETIRFVARCMPHAVRVDAPSTSGRDAARSLWKPVERRRRNLTRTLSSLGAAPDVTPLDALHAALAGFAGREIQFLNHAARAMRAGNIDALAALVETINNAACGRSDTVYWRAFGAGQRMVGN